MKNMNNIQILRNMVLARTLVLFFSVILLIFALLFPITMLLLHPIVGLIGIGIYLYLAIKTIFKHNFFEGKVHSINLETKELNIVDKVFFKFKLKNIQFRDFQSLVVERHEFGFTPFRIFKLSAIFDGEKMYLSQMLIRRTINEISKDLREALNCDVFLKNVGEFKLIDSNKYSFDNLDYNYSYSPNVYLVNAILWLIIVPFGGFLPYICLPIISVLIFTYLNSKKNLEAINVRQTF